MSSGITRINGIAIGGTDAFSLRASRFNDFETAIATKIGEKIGAPAPEPTAIPEPGVTSMLSLGFLTIGFALRRRRTS